MSIYKYIYYTILSVYKRFSKDPQINIFALGFFSVIISFNILSITGVYEYFVKHTYTFGGKSFVIIVFGIVLLFNTIYFLFNNKKQEKYYNEFCNKKNKTKTVLVAVYVIFVFVLTFWIATLLREKNLR